MALGVVAALLWKPAPPTPFRGVEAHEVPARLGGYISEGDSPVPEDVRAALSSGSIVSRYYRRDADSSSSSSSSSSSAGDTGMELLLIGGTDRSALHDPRSCFVGSGWRIENDHTETLPGTQVEARVCHVVDAEKQTGFDTLYLYVVDGKVIHQVTQIRTQMLLSAVIGKKNRPVYFLRIVIPLPSDPALRQRDHERLMQFAAEAWTALEPRLRNHEAGDTVAITDTGD